MDKKTMETVASVKGRIVIPASVRQQMGITEGTRIRVEVDEEKHHIILTPITREYIRSWRGSLRGKGALKILEEARRGDRD